MAQQNAVPGFVPSTSGLQFPNFFPKGSDYPVIKLPFGLPPITQDANTGLCGGFVFTVLDMFLHNPPIPGSAGGASAPLDPSPFFTYLCDRLLASFGTNPALCNAVKYVQWIQDPDTNQDIFGATVWPGINMLVIRDEWPAIKADIDRGVPSPLSLVMEPKCGPLDVPGIVDALSHSHQVLAYGYSLDDAGNLTLSIYDPNEPGINDVTIKVNVEVWQPGEQANSPLDIKAPMIYSALAEPRAVRALFRTQYTQADPSQVLPDMASQQQTTSGAASQPPSAALASSASTPAPEGEMGGGAGPTPIGKQPYKYQVKANE